MRSVLRTSTWRRRTRGATAADGFESKRSCAELKRRRYTPSGQSRRRRARSALGLARGAAEMSLPSTFESLASGGMRRLVRRRSQLTRDSVQQPGKIGVGQTAARNHVTGMDDTGVIARESHRNTRK